MRFTLGKMFLAIAMLALACAGMTNCNRWWAHGIVIVTVLMYVFVTIQAVVSRDRTRAVSTIFALVGGGYLLLSLCPAFHPFSDLILTNRALISIGTRFQLPPSMVRVDWLGKNGEWEQFIGSADDVDKIVPQNALKKSVKPHTHAWPQEFNPNEMIHARGVVGAFLLTGHCVFSWLFALLAAWLAGQMYDRRERATKEAT
jgi:hypothetical protein